MITLEDYLIQYKEATIKIINTLEKDEFDLLEEYLNTRESIITSINGLNYDNSLFIEISNKYNIPELEHKANEDLLSKMKFFKQQISGLQTNKNVNSNYNPKNYVDSLYFNKKI